MKLAIKDATLDDINAIKHIYDHYVSNTTASFEETPPSVEELTTRLKDIQVKKLPFLVILCDKKVAGYAYATQYRSRSAYRFTVENSIYIDPEYTGKGLGKQLLQEIVNRCKELGYRQMVSVITGNNNVASIKLHESLGFNLAGTLKEVGFKAEQWIDSIFMQKTL